MIDAGLGAASIGGNWCGHFGGYGHIDKLIAIMVDTDPLWAEKNAERIGTE